MTVSKNKYGRYVDVTPAVAKWLLENMPAGPARPVSDMATRGYVRAMHAGTFSPDAAPLTLDRGDMLVTGRLVLFAVIRSGLTVRVRIRYEGDEDESAGAA